ncbi:hypothetical protein PR202_ga20810 [Eleusine coracana subsp. coracana]|uniref:Glucan endo-1,3-beta-D-glucosidase n=1 Tax=Eleusine coracana subsp. coracana TaxID=191504 RepID=A0AAV5CXK4_ELECO|nr:hypothetical protein PR202_ga20810 [Eleusine coracana subsp. coracana]
MLYAQVDAVYAAIQRLGHTDVEVKVSETGWPSRGDPDEHGATVRERRDIHPQPPAPGRGEAGYAHAPVHARRRLRLRALQREPKARTGVGAELRDVLSRRHARLQPRTAGPGRIPPAGDDVLAWSAPGN